ncbi:MAG: acylphosphatase [Planctomycetes bacterium]|nr:acylphosphatase [Planctomycetota bacterium]
MPNKSTENYTRAHVFADGRVQGVFFRASTRAEAIQLGLTGWVKNCKDGRVEAVFEGAKENVEKAVEWCRKGPPGASVTHVEVDFGHATGEFGTFEIETDSF